MPISAFGGHAVARERTIGRPPRPRLEAVVGQQDHRRLGTGQFQQPAEHLIVELVDRIHNLPVMPVVLVRHPRHLRSAVAHEIVPDTVQHLIIDGEQVPRFRLHDLRGDGVDGHAAREMPRQPGRAIIRRQVDLADGWYHVEQVARGKLARMEPQIGDRRCQPLRMNEAFRQCVDVFGPGRQRVQHPFGEINTGDRFNRVRHRPGQHTRAQPVLPEQIPQRLAAPTRTARRNDPQALRGGFYEP